MQSRVALVTGASSGIGRATAIALAQEGAAVALLALAGPALESAAEDCRAVGARIVAQGADVGDSSAVAEAFAEAERHLGPIDARVQQRGDLGRRPDN